MMKYYDEDTIDEVICCSFPFCQWPDDESAHPRAKDWMRGRYKITGRHKDKWEYLFSRLELPGDYPPAGWKEYFREELK